MIKNKKACEKCGKEICTNSYNRHVRSCDGIYKEKIDIKDEWQQDNGLYKCPYCGKECKKRGIGYHILRMHTEEGKKIDPNIGYKNGTRVNWKKGLTKETDERVKKSSETFKKNYKDGKFIASMTNKHHTEKTKKILSEKRIKYLKNNKDKHNWSMYHGEETEPEKRFKIILEKLNINDEIYQYYRPEDFDKEFEIDFVLLNSKIAFEINGNQHYDKDGNLLEYYKNRHEYIKNKGWKVIEIHYLLCFHEDRIIEIIKNIIKNEELNVNKITKEIFNHKKIRKEQNESRIKERKIEIRVKKEKQLYDKYYQKINLLKEIDFTKKGWKEKAQKIFKCKNERRARQIIRKYFPDIWEKCYKQKYIKTLNNTPIV